MTPAVVVGSQQGFFTTIKGTIQWTARLAPTVDLTAVASVGTVLPQSPVSVAIGGGTPFTASATSLTVRPAFSALLHEAPPLRRPTVTFTPLSFRFSACAWPCEP